MTASAQLVTPRIGVDDTPTGDLDWSVPPAEAAVAQRWLAQVRAAREQPQAATPPNPEVYCK